MAAVTATVTVTLDELLGEQIEQIVDALKAGEQDIAEWRQLAIRQREVTPDPDHTPTCPHQSGIDKSERVQKQMWAAIALLRKLQAEAGDKA